MTPIYVGLSMSLVSISQHDLSINEILSTTAFGHAILPIHLDVNTETIQIIHTS